MSNGLIVCNAGPLIALSLVGHLDLLHRLYGRVLAPEAVMREVVESGAGRTGATEVAAASWLEHVQLDSPPGPLLAKNWVPARPPLSQLLTDSAQIWF